MRQRGGLASVGALVFDVGYVTFKRLNGPLEGECK
jgi:hypothetical protein